MALRLLYQPSFVRSVKRLDSTQKEIIGLLLEALSVYYATGCDVHAAHRSAPRFFYKQLRKPYYEAGIERTLRIVIRRDGENCIAMVAGNHNQIEQFLRDI